MSDKPKLLCPRCGRDDVLVGKNGPWWCRFCMKAITKRVGRRIFGKMAGRLMGRLFR